MNKQTKVIGLLLLCNLILTSWLLFQYKNAPPVEENIRVRVGQSDRFIAENANNLEKMKSELKSMEGQLTELKAAMSHHSQMIQAHEQELRSR